MPLGILDQSSITNFCQNVSELRMDVSEWTPSRFIEAVADKVLGTVDFISKNSHFLGPICSAFQSVFGTIKQVKINKFQAAVLGARLLRLVKLTFSHIDIDPDLVQSAAFSTTIEYFEQVCCQISNVLREHNDANFLRRGFSRSRYEREFRDCNKLLDDFQAELTIGLLANARNKPPLSKQLSRGHIETIIDQDEEDFFQSHMDYYQSELTALNSEYSQIRQQLVNTSNPHLKSLLEARLKACEDKRRELSENRSHLSTEVEMPDLINEKELEIDWSSSHYSGQSEIVMVTYQFAEAVVKLYHGSEGLNPSLAREWDILRSLPNVPSLLRAYGIVKVFKKDRPRFGLVMERLSGMTLTNKVQENLCFSAKLDILIGISSALSVCHESKFLHRDLKPDNILFRGNCPVIIDWGSGKNTGKSNLSMSLNSNRILTPSWASPELVGDETIYTDGIDVFSFALIAIYVFTKESIWQEFLQFPNSDLMIINALKSGNLPPIPNSPNIPSQLYPVLEQCLCQDYKSRPSMSEVLSVFKAIKQSSLPHECLLMSNKPLFDYGISILTSSYIEQASKCDMEESADRILDYLEHCHQKNEAIKLQAVVTTIEQYHSLSRDIINKKVKIFDLITRRIELQEYFIKNVVLRKDKSSSRLGGSGKPAPSNGKTNSNSSVDSSDVVVDLGDLGKEEKQKLPHKNWFRKWGLLVIIFCLLIVTSLTFWLFFTNGGILYRSEFSSKRWLNNQPVYVFNIYNITNQEDGIENELATKLQYRLVTVNVEFDETFDGFKITLARYDSSRTFYVWGVEFSFSNEGAVFYSVKELENAEYGVFDAENICYVQEKEFFEFLDQTLQSIAPLEPFGVVLVGQYTVEFFNSTHLQVDGDIFVQKNDYSEIISLSLLVTQCNQLGKLDISESSLLAHFNTTIIQVDSLDDESHITNVVELEVSSFLEKEFKYSIKSYEDGVFEIMVTLEPLTRVISIIPTLELSPEGELLLEAFELLAEFTISNITVDDDTDDKLIESTVHDVLLETLFSAYSFDILVTISEPTMFEISIVYHEVSKVGSISVESIELSEAATILNDVLMKLDEPLQLNHCYCHFPISVYNNSIWDSIDLLVSDNLVVVDVQYLEDKLFEINLSLDTAQRTKIYELDTSKSCSSMTDICDGIDHLYVSNYKWSKPANLHKLHKKETFENYLLDTRSNFDSLDFEFISTFEQDRNGRICYTVDEFEVNAPENDVLLSVRATLEAKATRVVLFWVWAPLVSFFAYLPLFGILMIPACIISPFMKANKGCFQNLSEEAKENIEGFYVACTALFSISVASIFVIQYYFSHYCSK
ncbi:hypothetical protein P9112_010585 [Eukaryota sp. TZLM1-RC]